MKITTTTLRSLNTLLLLLLGWALPVPRPGEAKTATTLLRDLALNTLLLLLLGRALPVPRPGEAETATTLLRDLARLVPNQDPSALRNQETQQQQAMKRRATITNGLALPAPNLAHRVLKRKGAKQLSRVLKTTAAVRDRGPKVLSLVR
jgi:hypothetical protein